MKLKGDYKVVLPAPNPIKARAMIRELVFPEGSTSKYAYKTFARIFITRETNKGSLLLARIFAQVPNNGEAISCPTLYDATTHPRNEVVAEGSNCN